MEINWDKIVKKYLPEKYKNCQIRGFFEDPYDPYKGIDYPINELHKYYKGQSLLRVTIYNELFSGTYGNVENMIDALAIELTWFSHYEHPTKKYNVMDC